MANSEPISLLVIEDTADHREQVAEQLADSDPPFAITFAENCTIAVRELAENPFDCVLMDMQLPDGTGAGLLAAAKYQLMATPVVAYSSSADPSIAMGSMLGGSATFVGKQEALTEHKLRGIILKTIERHEARRRVERADTRPILLDRLTKLVGATPTADEDAERLAEERLQLLYESAVQTMDTGVLLIEQRERILFANDGFKRLLGMTSIDKLPGYPNTTLGDVFAVETVNRIHSQNRRETRFEGMLVTRTGDHIPITLGETELGSAGLLCTITDERHSHEQQRAVEAANMQLRGYAEALREKNARLSDLTDTAHRFVDNVAHEFRTPLTVVQEFASIINDEIGGPVTDAQRDFLNYILSAAHDLSQMVDDFLDSSKLKNGTLRVERAPCGVAELFEMVSPAVESRAAAKSIRLAESVAEDLPIVYADLEKAGRTLLNLVINAIKFSPEGELVTIAAERSEADEVIISVTDRGIGMQPEELAVVGERFRQVGDPMKTSMKGFGLGLNIAKELVWLNLGHLAIRSQHGKGSTFSFTLPVYDPPALLDRYGYLMQEQYESLSMGALLLTHRGPTPSGCSLKSLIAAMSYPMDLLLPTPGCRSIVALGKTHEADRWIARLVQAWDKHRASAAHEEWSTLDISLIGEGDVDDVIRAARMRVTPVDTEVSTCV